MKLTKEVVAFVILSLVGATTWYELGRKDSGVTGAEIVENYTPMSAKGLAIRRVGLVQEYRPSGRNPFLDDVVHLHTPIAPRPGIPPGISTQSRQVELPLPYKFFGYGTVPNGTPRRAFLTDGADVLVVTEGEAFLERFRVLKIGNATIDFEEISSGRQGKANMEDAGPTT
ncbi:MAG TPA: hypothetical protein VGF20_13560 [Candidatus Acidoferrum sp.]|jgi:hypothetical protein